MKLNEAQSEAVSYTDGPCLVLAGAGSGKTRVITTKITSLIRSKGYLPESICAVTFTNKAAAEMRERVSKDLGQDTARRLTVSTFHSLGLNIIRQDHHVFGLGRNFSLFDQYDAQKIIADIIKDEFPQLLTEKSDKTLAETAASTISLWKGSLKTPEDLAASGCRTWIALTYGFYEKYLRACNAVDFDDLIFRVTTKLISDEVFRNKWQDKFRYILVDEYQDTNENQYQLLKILSSKYRTFTVVGDDDQSIYSWRGARPENIRMLSEDYPDLKVIKLEMNYRSTAHILHCANGLIANNEHMFSKTLRSVLGDGPLIQVREVNTEDDEASRVAELIFAHKYHHHGAFRDYAVLYRSNFQSRAIEKAFRENHIPCVITGGSSFFEQQEIKDVMAWCRVICNPRDDAALLRIINVPRRGIGAESIGAISQASKTSGKSLFDSMLSPELTKKLSSKQMQAIASFVILVTNLRQLLISKQDKTLAKELLDRVNYENYLKVSTQSEAAGDFKIRNVRSLMQWIQELISGSKDREPLNFVEAVDKLGLREMLDRGNDHDDSGDAVQLMTLHASKGLEFPYVFLIGCEEGILPHRNSISVEGGIEEERRLCYVGVTRAKQELNILLCRQRRMRIQDNGEEEIKYGTPSRFLTEMPKEDLQWHRIGTREVISQEQKLATMDEVLKRMQALTGSTR